MGIFQAANSRTPMVTTDPLPAENIQLIENGKGISGRGKMASPFEKMRDPLPAPKDLGTVQKQLTSALAPEIRAARGGAEGESRRPGDQPAGDRLF